MREENDPCATIYRFFSFLNENIYYFRHDSFNSDVERLSDGNVSSSSDMDDISPAGNKLQANTGLLRPADIASGISYFI